MELIPASLGPDDENTTENIGLTEQQKQFIEVLDAYKGSVSESCRVAGISRTTFYNWLNNLDRFKEEVEIVRENCIDYVESKLMNNIEEGNVVAQIFYLKTIGRRRGYIEKYDINLDKEADQATEITDYLKRGQLRVEAMKSDVVSEQ